jgi:4-carboxymuconolactone decarboxylase
LLLATGGWLLAPDQNRHQDKDFKGEHLYCKEIFSMETYYKPEDLPKFEEIGKEAPELARKFFEYYNAVFADGELTEREKALIALAVAHAVQCPYCIDAYTQACLEKGSNLAEMTEAIHVVTAIRGGASLVHGVQMRNIADKLSM